MAITAKVSLEDWMTLVSTFAFVVFVKYHCYCFIGIHK
jgi:hypothetical protein